MHWTPEYRRTTATRTTHGARPIASREEAMPTERLEEVREEEETACREEKSQVGVCERPAGLGKMARGQHRHDDGDQPRGDVDHKPSPGTAAIPQKPSHVSNHRPPTQRAQPANGYVCLTKVRDRGSGAIRRRPGAIRLLVRPGRRGTCRASHADERYSSHAFAVGAVYGPQDVPTPLSRWSGTSTTSRMAYAERNPGKEPATNTRRKHFRALSLSSSGPSATTTSPSRPCAKPLIVTARHHNAPSLAPRVAPDPVAVRPRVEAAVRQKDSAPTRRRR
jgi:hypothetical protein